jgi:thiol-disulfide isomerase/thioredoxin
MKSLRAALLAVATVVAAVLALTACSSSGSGDSTYHYDGAQAVGTFIPVADRKPAQTFGGSLLSGGNYDLSRYRGKVVVINFWGVWCPPCRVETPQFGKVYDAYRNKGVTFVGVDIKDGSRAGSRSFLADNHVTYPVIWDEIGETAVRLGEISTQAMPFTVLLDRQHRVAGVYISPLTQADLEPMLNKLLAEHQSGTSQ